MMKHAILLAIAIASGLVWSAQTRAQTPILIIDQAGVTPTPILEDQPFRVPLNTDIFCADPQITQIRLRNAPTGPNALTEPAAADKQQGLGFDDSFALVNVENAGFEILDDNPLPFWNTDPLTNGRGSLPASVYANGIPEGARFAWANFNNSIRQTLTEVAAAGTTYTLLVDVGNPPTAEIGVYNIVLQLRDPATGELTSVAEGTTPVPVAGQWLTSELVYTAGAADEGMEMIIQIAVTAGLQTHFDNVRLFASGTSAEGTLVSDLQCCSQPDSFVTLVAPEDFAGRVVLDLTAEADCGATVDSDSAQAILSLADVNDPPIISLSDAIPPVILVDGRAKDLTLTPVTVLDPFEPGQTAQFDLAALPDTIGFVNSPGVFDAMEAIPIQLRGTQTGILQFTVSAQDNGGTLNGGVSTSTVQFSVDVRQADLSVSSLEPTMPEAGTVFDINYVLNNMPQTATLEPLVFTQDGVAIPGFEIVSNTLLPVDGILSGRITVRTPPGATGLHSAEVIHSVPDADYPDGRVFSVGTPFDVNIAQGRPIIATTSVTPTPALEDNVFTINFEPVGFSTAAQLRDTVFSRAGFTVIGEQCCATASSFVRVRPPAEFSGLVNTTISIEDPQNEIVVNAPIQIRIEEVNDAPLIQLGAAIDPVDIDGEQLFSVIPVASIDPVEPAQMATFTATIAEASAEIATLASPGPYQPGEELELTLSGVGGAVLIDVVAMDNGGTANGGVDQSEAQYRFDVAQIPTTVEVGGNTRPTIGSAERLVTFTITNTGDAAAASVEVVVSGSNFDVSGGRTALRDCRTVFDEATGQISVFCGAIDPASDWQCSDPADGTITCSLSASLPPGGSTDLIVSGTGGGGSVTATVNASNTGDPQIITVDVGP